MRKNIIIYPFLFSLYPIFFLYSHNIQEIEISEIYFPLLVTILATGLFFILFRYITKDWHKAGLITTLFTLLFFSYGRIFDFLEQLNIYFPTFRHDQFVAASLLLFGYLAYFIGKSIINFKKTTKILNVIAAILILINIYDITAFEVKNLKENQLFESEYKSLTQNLETHNSKNYPDIYFILLDEFASTDTIKETYNYTPTLSLFLKEKGFFVATKSTTKFSSTWPSLAERLNFTTFDKILPTKELFDLILNNKVARYLKSKGYKYIYISDQYINKSKYDNPFSDFDLTDLKPNSKTSEKTLNSFESLLIRTSILRKYYYESIADGKIQQEAELLKVNSVKKAMEIPGPKFIFSHHLISHAPFVFGEQGQTVKKDQQYDWQNKQIYLGTYIFTENLIENLVSELLEKSKNPPIIIIQSDHGPRGGMGPNDNPKKADLGLEWSKIFNAYYFPDKNYQDLSDSINPTNTFITIFNQYFNEKFQLEK